MRGRPEQLPTPSLHGLVVAGICCLVLAILVTSIEDRSTLGLPSYWAWVLTALQVAALWSASTGRNSGWLVGASIQIPWIVYAVITTQFGFVPGCIVSAAVQARGYMRRRSGHPSRNEPTYA